MIHQHRYLSILPAALRSIQAPFVYGHLASHQASTLDVQAPHKDMRCSVLYSQISSYLRAWRVCLGILIQRIKYVPGFMAITASILAIP